MLEKLKEKVQKGRNVVKTACITVGVMCVSVVPAFASPAADPVGVDSILDNSLKSGMTSVTGFVTKIVPYVIGICLLGAGIKIVKSLLTKGTGSVK